MPQAGWYLFLTHLGSGRSRPRPVLPLVKMSSGVTASLHHVLKSKCTGAIWGIKPLTGDCHLKALTQSVEPNIYLQRAQVVQLYCLCLT